MSHCFWLIFYESQIDFACILMTVYAWAHNQTVWITSHHVSNRIWNFEIFTPLLFTYWNIHEFQTVVSHIYESFIYRVGVSLIVLSFQFRTLNCRSFEVIIAIPGPALNSVLQQNANKQDKCAISSTNSNHTEYRPRDTWSWKGQLESFKLESPKWNWKDWTWKVLAEVGKF